MPCPRRGSPTLFILAAPMAWGKDAILLGLKDRYGGAVVGEYDSALPGRTVMKKGSKNFGRPIVAKRRPVHLFGGSRLVLLGKGDDPGNGLPEALVAATLEQMASGRDVLFQSRQVGAAFTTTCDALLRQEVGVGRIAWLYPADPPIGRLVERMLGRGGKDPETVRVLAESSLKRWRQSTRLIRGQVGDGARGFPLPTCNVMGQVNAVIKVLVGFGALPADPKRSRTLLAGG